MVSESQLAPAMARYTLTVEPIADRFGHYFESYVCRATTMAAAWAKAKPFLDSMGIDRPRAHIVSFKREERLRHWRYQHKFEGPWIVIPVKRFDG